MLIAAVTENEEKQGKIDYLVEVISENDTPLIDMFRNIFLARYDQTVREAAAKALLNYEFTDEQRNFIWQWIEQEKELVGFAEV